MGVREKGARYLTVVDDAASMEPVTKAYRLTDIGPIPKDWKLEPMRDLLSQPATYGVVKAGQFVRTGIPMLRGGDIKNGRINSADLPMISAEKSGEYSRTVLRSKDVVIALVGYPGEAAVVDPSLEGSNISRAVGLLRPTGVLPHYLCSYLNSPAGRSDFLKPGAGSAQLVVNLRDLNKLLVPLPLAGEQKAIAAAISDADALIESLQQLIAKKRALKQGAMQALLTGLKRLPGFSQDWGVRKLGDFGDVYGGLSGKTKRDFGHGYGRFVTFMGVMSSVVVDMTKVEAVDVQASESQYAVSKSDLLFNGSSETPQEIGLCAVVNEQVDGVYLNSFCFGYRMQPGAPLDPLYLAYFYRSNAGRELLAPLAQGAIRYNLSKRALLELGFELPPKEEQTAIATVLSDMDTEIDALETRLAKTRDLKAGMMQALLTGRIRLPPDHAA